MKNLKWMLPAILFCGLFLMSCSNDDNTPLEGRTYEISQKITNRRDCHALKMIASDALNLCPLYSYSYLDAE